MNTNGVIIETYRIEQGKTKKEIDVSALTSGIYIIVAEIENQKIIKKVVKN